MVKLKANFESDWIAHLRTHMTEVQGWEEDEVQHISDRDICTCFFESLRRRIVQKPRVLKIADDFRCPVEEEAGWKALQDKVRRGEDLNPHLSGRHASLFNQDGLLAEWGAHHFHLGTGPDPQKSSYVKRTGPLVYALVDDITFCAINVYPHGSWEEIGIIESIHRNWPDMIRKYRVKGIGGEILDKPQRRTLRKKNLNVCVATADGTVYMPIGGGVTGAGVKLESLMCADRWHAEIQVLQPEFENQLDQVMTTLKRHGYAGENEIEAQLKITETGYQVFFPKYGVRANLQLNPASKAAFELRHRTYGF
jgi:hypothetical protein